MSKEKLDKDDFEYASNSLFKINTITKESIVLFTDFEIKSGYKKGFFRNVDGFAYFYGLKVFNKTKNDYEKWGG